MNYFIYFLLSTAITSSLQASSFFLPDSDTGLLITLGLKYRPTTNTFRAVN